jgi:hypothetical protein
MNKMKRKLVAAQRGMHAPMGVILQEFGRASAQAAVQFNKAFRDSTAWQHKQREGIGGA